MKLKNWHALAVISCSLWLAYYPALSAPLNSVDDVRLAHELLNHPSFTWVDFWMPRSKSFFRPLVNSSFILDSLVWGFEAPFLHLENILLHWLNTLLVFRLTWLVASRLGLNALAVSSAAALLFGLHPINSEAVIWIAGRADLLATTFTLLALLCLTHYLQRGTVLWGVTTVLTFFAGTLAKETAIFVLPGLFALGWVGSRSAIPSSRPVPLGLALLPALGSLISLTVYVALRFLALQGGDFGIQHVSYVVTGASLPGQTVQKVAAVSHKWSEMVESVLSGSGFYARKLVQPFPLNFGIIEVGDGYFWVGCLLIPLVIFLLWRLTWWSSFILTAMSLASISLLVALGDFSWTPFAERYMYGPAAMLAIGVGVAGGQLSARYDHIALKPCLIGTLGVLLLLCAWGIFQRGLVWQDNLTLFADTVQKSPNFSLAHNQLAQALWDRNRKSEALDILRRMDMPESQVAYINKILILVEEGRLVEARHFLLENLGKPQAHAYHTVILERLVDITERLREESSDAEQIVQYDSEMIDYLKALSERTGKPFYLYRLGQKQMAKGDFSAARESFAMAYAKFPPESIYREPARKLAEKLSGQ